jgi:hypothetical protein
VARGDLATSFHEAGHVAAAWSRGLKIHNAKIVLTPGFQGLVEYADPGCRPAIAIGRIGDRRVARRPGSAAHTQPALLAHPSWRRGFQAGC